MVKRYFSPTNPGSRHVVINSFTENSEKKKTYKKAIKIKNSNGGRNHSGVISCRNRGGVGKRFYRKIDKLKENINIKGIVKRIEYDPNRKARIAIVEYKNGKKGYIISPNGIFLGKIINNVDNSLIEIGDTNKIFNIPLGYNVHNVEINRGDGGKISRSAGTFSKIIYRNNGFCSVRIPSGEIRLFRETCLAKVGIVGNKERINSKLGKAGRKRWLGFRPKVRGSSINPVDHPHGGGEGRCPIGLIHPYTKFGKKRIGVKTRKNKKYSNKFILTRKKTFNLKKNYDSTSNMSKSIR